MGPSPFRPAHSCRVESRAVPADAARQGGLAHAPHPAARMDLSIVVVTYNSRDHVLECLRSLGPEAGGSGEAATECVVVDNDSGDGTADAVSRRVPAALPSVLHSSCPCTTSSARK